MNIEEIMKRWSSVRKDAKASVEWWDGKASGFATKELPTGESSLAMRLILDNHMLEKGQTALDVGCGGGRFSFALEKLGASVTGTDFSPRMIEECEKAKLERESLVKFKAWDWHNADLNELGWNDCFDLVLANMTPAVASADTFMKLWEASRDWCVMVKPTRRRNTVLDKLTDLLGIPADTEALDEALMYAFELLWLHGKKPKIEYEEQVWEDSMEVEQSIREYILRISSTHVLSPEQKMSIGEYLNSISVNGSIKETINTTIAALYWQV